MFSLFWVVGPECGETGLCVWGVVLEVLEAFTHFSRLYGMDGAVVAVLGRKRSRFHAVSWEGREVIQKRW